MMRQLGCAWMAGLCMPSFAKQLSLNSNLIGIKVKMKNMSGYAFHFSKLINSSVEVLRLHCIEISFAEETFSMKIHSLRELHLVDSFALDEQIKNMMAFCVNLEILSILDIRGLHNLRIVSNKLKHFKLSYFGFVEGDSLQLCAPSLESVTFDNVFGRKYALKDSSCLVEAHLDFGSRGWEEFVCWTYLVRFLSSVKRLCIQNMWNWFPDYVDIKRQPEDCSFEQPMTSEEGRHGKIGEEVFSRRFGFGNLKHLELLFGYSKDDLLGLEILLQNCPQLETMVLVNSYPSHCDGGLQKL
ncbi:OLC1v1006684C1 [Oldenlandia corymbosa var. corymbosa]|uniref:OLC1v1006684C1 n=1 Tax=Oldenlandia corymbosa var. corymbosa TaxID=529605 RepID=A0AAV1DKA7_OLDCO|nr:OLC1v1006684C1 [Oldenlandia corymbosa var. corymbosa]